MPARQRTQGWAYGRVLLPQSLKRQRWGRRCCDCFGACSVPASVSARAAGRPKPFAPRGVRGFGEWEVRTEAWIETPFHVRTGITSVVRELFVSWMQKPGGRRREPRTKSESCDSRRCADIELAVELGTHP
jgi:hypothetical protein